MANPFTLSAYQIRVYDYTSEEITTVDGIIRQFITDDLMPAILIARENNPGDHSCTYDEPPNWQDLHYILLSKYAIEAGYIFYGMITMGFTVEW